MCGASRCAVCCRESQGAERSVRGQWCRHLPGLVGRRPWGHFARQRFDAPDCCARFVTRRHGAVRDGRRATRRPASEFMPVYGAFGRPSGACRTRKSCTTTPSQQCAGDRDSRDRADAEQRAGWCSGNLERWSVRGCRTSVRVTEERLGRVEACDERTEVESGRVSTGDGPESAVLSSGGLGRTARISGGSWHAQARTSVATGSGSQTPGRSMPTPTVTPRPSRTTNELLVCDVGAEWRRCSGLATAVIR